MPNYFNENFIYKCLFYWKLINFYANQFNSKYRYSKTITIKFTVFAITEKYSIFKLAVKKIKNKWNINSVSRTLEKAVYKVQINL